jgi:hypothetical protein
MACAWLGLTGYEWHYLLHPPQTFTSSPSDLTLSLTGLSGRLATSAAAQAPENLSKAPASKYYLMPIIPIKLITDYLNRSEADFLLVDFSEIDLKDESLFQQIYAKIRSPPSAEAYKGQSGEPQCSLLMDSLLETLRRRAALHMVTADTEVYEAAFQLAWIYQQWYGQEAYEAALASPRYPVVVLKHTEKWANLTEMEKKRLLDFYIGLMKWVGTAHIFIEASHNAARVLESLDQQVPKPDT